jgi:hypothetical protein
VQKPVRLVRKQGPDDGARLAEKMTKQILPLAALKHLSVLAVEQGRQRVDDGVDDELSKLVRRALHR